MPQSESWPLTNFFNKCWKLGYLSRQLELQQLTEEWFAERYKPSVRNRIGIGSTSKSFLFYFVAFPFIALKFCTILWSVNLMEGNVIYVLTRHHQCPLLFFLLFSLDPFLLELAFLEVIFFSTFFPFSLKYYVCCSFFFIRKFIQYYTMLICFMVFINLTVLPWLVFCLLWSGMKNINVNLN